MLGKIMKILDCIVVEINKIYGYFNMDELLNVIGVWVDFLGCDL